jgi:cyclopropane-fatty-acyl-phospholipid synthase
MNYTCAYWKDVKDENDLDQAQYNKMDLVARKLKLKPGMKVLDIGSGFGAMAKHLAQNYQVNVVGYNSTLPVHVPR